MSSATTTVRWVTGQQYVGTDSTHHSIVLSTENENAGVKPSDVMLIALAACTAVDVVDILAKKRTPIDLLEITTTGQQDAEPPWAFRQIHLKYRLRGKNLTETGVAQAIQLSEEKYCSVAATLRGVADITTEFEIIF